MLSRTIVVDTKHVHPSQVDLDAAVAEFKRQITAEGRTLEGTPDVTLLSHHVGQSMTFNVKGNATAVATGTESDKPSGTKPGGKANGNA